MWLTRLISERRGRGLGHPLLINRLAPFPNCLLFRGVAFTWGFERPCVMGQPLRG